MSGLRQGGRQVTRKLSSRDYVRIEGLVQKQNVHFSWAVANSWISAAAVSQEQHIHTSFEQGPQP